jgi:hypothetical protein
MIGFIAAVLLLAGFGDFLRGNAINAIYLTLAALTVLFLWGIKDYE